MKNTKQHNGFKIPEDYFNKFEENIIKKIESSKKHGFETPYNYFQDFEEKILKKNIKNKRKGLLSKLIQGNFMHVGIAASFLIIFSLIFYKNQNKMHINQFSINEVNLWLEDNIDGISLYTITEVIEESELEDFFIFEDSELINQLEGIDIEFLLDDVNETL